MIFPQFTSDWSMRRWAVRQYFQNPLYNFCWLAISLQRVYAMLVVKCSQSLMVLNTNSVKFNLHWIAAKAHLCTSQITLKSFYIIRYADKLHRYKPGNDHCLVQVWLFAGRTMQVFLFVLMWSSSSLSFTSLWCLEYYEQTFKVRSPLKPSTMTALDGFDVHDGPNKGHSAWTGILCKLLAVFGNMGYAA